MIAIDIVSSIPRYFPDNYYFIVISRIVVSVIIGGIIGFEREHKNRPAGFRTHILVCVSSCSLMVLSELVFQKYYNTYGVVSDPMRLSAQIVSGVGFLGAGTIIHYGNSVKGLTTAASIWAVAALGIVCGSGFFFLAFFGLCTIELVLIFFDRYSKRNIFRPKTYELFLTITQDPEIIGKIMVLISLSDMNLVHMDIEEANKINIIDGANKGNSRVKIILSHKANLKTNGENTNKNMFSNDNIDYLIWNLEQLDGVVDVK